MIVSMSEDTRLLIPKDGHPRHYVREWRKFRGLTQERLAERIPYTTGAISQLETGRVAYTQPIIEALAEALQCEPGDLLSRNPEKEGEVISLFDGLDERQKALAIDMLTSIRKRA